MKDPNTGKFATGNPGRPKGTKNVRTLQWEELGDTITGHHANRFTELLDELWESEDTAERMKAADLFLRTMDYFKPKLQRIQIPVERENVFAPTIMLPGCNNCQCEHCKNIPPNTYPNAASVHQSESGNTIIREIIR